MVNGLMVNGVSVEKEVNHGKTISEKPNGLNANFVKGKIDTIIENIVTQYRVSSGSK